MRWLPDSYFNFVKKFWQKVRGVEEKTVRARTEEGKFVADDKSTPNVNEAYKTVEVNNKEMKSQDITPLTVHERECALRFEYIEKRLDEGSAKFKRLETLIWGVYPVVITCLLASRYI